MKPSGLPHQNNQAGPDCKTIARRMRALIAGAGLSESQAPPGYFDGTALNNSPVVLFLPKKIQYDAWLNLVLLEEPCIRYQP